MSTMEKCVSFENVQLENGVVSVPEDMCEQEGVFSDVFSLETLTNELTKQQQDSLMAYLPSFPENDEEEKIKTLKSLFSGENFRFGNPLEQFFQKLNKGFFNPEVAELSKHLKNIAYEQYKCQQKKYYCKLLKDVVVSRKLLLEAASRSGPNEHIKIEGARNKSYETAKERAKWRYFMELQEVREECGELDTSSEDENYPGPSPKLPRKQKKQLLEGALSPDIVRVTSTTSTPSGPLGSLSASLTLAMFEMTDDRYRQMLLRHQQRRAQGEVHPGLDTSNVTLEGIMSRTALAKRSASKSENTTKKKVKSEPTEKKPKANHQNNSSMNATSSSSTISCGQTPTISLTQKETALSISTGVSHVTNTVSPCIQTMLEVKVPVPTPGPATQLMAPPVTIEEDIKVLIPKIEPLQEDFEVDVGSDVEGQTPVVRSVIPEPEPQQQMPPLNFFALLRDLFYELPEQKMSMVRLEERVRLWMDSPVAMCTEWLNMHDSWVDLVSSALRFLAGDLLGILPENFVPYVDYREKQQHWQWIGAGRDTDDHLVTLCQHWLLSKDNLALESLEACQGSPPPPRVATDWTVRPSSDDEKTTYRDQECVRYQNPHRAFTFRIHGYESVVGPVKGVYGKESGVNKAREHSLLVSDRPPFVTILSLVRDAAARLPNGEGTRADICELLRDSQYLAPANDQQIHTVVSGALDRLHYEKDPCVKYDVNRKLWIYLHRHRTEEEFERIHQAQAAAAKAKKAMQKSKPPRTKSKESRPESAGPDAVSVNSSLSAALLTTTQSTTKPNTSPKQCNKQSSRRLSLPAQSPKGSCSPHHRDSISPSTPVNPKTNPLAALFTQQQQQQQQQTLQSAGEMSRPPSQGSLPSPKAVVANVNATQLLNVPQLQAANPSPSSTPTPPPLTIDMTPSSPAFVGQPPVLQPVISGTTVTSASLSKPVPVKRTVTQAPLQSFQTIVIKQEPVSKPSVTASLPILGRSATVASKPVMARLVSGTQVVSLGNLMSGAVSSSGQIKPLTAAALRMQGTSYVRPATGTAINVLQAGTRLPKFAVVSQSSTTGHGGVSQTVKLSPDQQDRILSPSAAVNLVAAAAAGSQGTPTMAHMTTSTKPHGLITTNAQGQGVVSMTTGSNIPAGVLLAGNNPVVIATQAALKPSSQTYVMAAPGTPSTVVMAAAQHNVRSAPINVKTLQGIKVIPVSQTVGAISNKNQPLLARLITPQPRLTLRPTVAGTSGTQTSVGLVQTAVSHSAVNKPQTLSLPVGGNQSVIVQVHTPALVNQEDVE